MDDIRQAEEKMIEAFHLMFGHYPEPAQLVHKTMRIVALNDACKAIGREIGMICAKHGPAEAHKGCLAAAAIKEQKAKWSMRKRFDDSGATGWTFWIPVEGHPDYYVHYSAGRVIEPR